MKTLRKTKNLILASLIERRKLYVSIFSAVVFLVLVAAISNPFSAYAQSQPQGGGWDVGKYGSFGLPSGGISDIISKLLSWLLLIFGFIGIIGFVISGITYLVSAGDEDTQKKAKRAMYYSITGVIVGLVGLVVLTAVNTLLKGESSNF